MKRFKLYFEKEVAKKEKNNELVKMVISWDELGEK